MRYWLMKSEPDAFSIDDLAARPKQTEPWDGVRNYQARNIMRDEMKIGDRVLFYHSNAKPPGVIGEAKVVREGYPDHTAFDPNEKYFDPKSDPAQPRWFMVEIQLVRKFDRLVSLNELKGETALQDMVLLNRSRLSVQPVAAAEFKHICRLAKQPDPNSNKSSS